MGRSGRLTLSEVRALFRLVGEVQELRGNVPAQMRHGVDGLARLLGADSGMAYRFDNWGLELEPRAMAVVTGGRVDTDYLRTLNRWSGELQIAKEDPFHTRTIGRPWAAERLVDVDPRMSLALLGRGTLDDNRPHIGTFTLLDAARVADHMAAYYVEDPVALRRGEPTRSMGVSLSLSRGTGTFTRKQRRLLALYIEELARLHAAGRLTPPVPLESRFSPRQRDVFERLLAGRTPKEVAADLGVSVHTVREHLAAMYKLAGVDSMQGLLAAKVRQLHEALEPPSPRAG